MKESYREQLAIDFGHKPYAGSGDAPGVAWVRGDAGQPLSSDIKIPVCRPCPDKGKATPPSPPRQGEGGHGGVIEPEHVSKMIILVMIILVDPGHSLTVIKRS